MTVENRPVVRTNDGLVVNVVAHDTNSSWTPPPGHFLGEVGGKIGDTWNGTIYVTPAPVEEFIPLVDVKRARRNYLIGMAQRELFDQFPLIRILNASFLGLAVVERVTIAAVVQDVRDRLVVKLQAVDNATTRAEVEAILWT